MGEVGTNSSESPNADLKMNGGINGNCDDDVEAMEVDGKDTSTESINKNVDNSEVTTTTNDNAMETDSNITPDDIQLNSNEANSKNDENKDTAAAKAHENGAAETEKTSDQHPIKEADSDKLIDKSPTEADTESNKVVDDDSESTVKIASDPLASDEKPTSDNEVDGERTNVSRSKSTENGTSATITSSNDKGE